MHTLVDFPERNPWEVCHGSPSEVINKRTTLEEICSSCIRKPSLISWYTRLRIYRRNQGQNEKKSSEKTFGTLCKIRSDSLVTPYGFYRETQKFFPKIFSFCPWFLRYARSRVYQEIKLGFLTQLEQIPSRFVSLLITPVRDSPGILKCV